MPGAEATGEDIKRWIEKFKSNYIADHTAYGDKRFKHNHGLEKATVVNIGQRLRVWLNRTNITSVHNRIRNFYGELKNAHDNTFS